MDGQLAPAASPPACMKILRWKNKSTFSAAHTSSRFHHHCLFLYSFMYSSRWSTQSTFEMGLS
jgi:hypothetical protein